MLRWAPDGYQALVTSPAPGARHDIPEPTTYAIRALARRIATRAATASRRAFRSSVCASVSSTVVALSAKKRSCRVRYDVSAAAARRDDVSMAEAAVRYESTASATSA